MPTRYEKCPRCNSSKIINQIDGSIICYKCGEINPPAKENFNIREAEVKIWNTRAEIERDRESFNKREDFSGLSNCIRNSSVNADALPLNARFMPNMKLFNEMGTFYTLDQTKEAMNFNIFF